MEAMQDNALKQCNTLKQGVWTTEEPLVAGGLQSCNVVYFNTKRHCVAILCISMQKKMLQALQINALNQTMQCTRTMQYMQ